MTPDVAPVAVIGGGIAGAAACLRLARSGVTPLWIAPCSGSGDKPGEHLAPAARPLLAGLGALDLLDRPVHRPANAMLSAWGSDRIAERHAMVHLEGPATVLDRTAFERDLSGLAQAHGVHRVEGIVAGAERRDGVWRLETDGAEHRARIMLDASGRAAAFAGPRTQRFRADRLAALYAFVEQYAASEVEPTRATLVEAVPAGWWYAALLADGRLALNHYSDPDLLPDGVTRDTAVFRKLLDETRHVARWIREAGFLLREPPRLASAGTTWIAPAAGEGWAAIGDAAAAFDPLSSHGMTTALWTAITASQAAIAMLSGDAEPLGRYAAKVAAGVQEFLVSRTTIYGREARFRDSEFWQRRRQPRKRA